MNNTVSVVDKIAQNPNDFVGTGAILIILYLVLMRIMRSNDKLIALLSHDKLREDKPDRN